MSMNGLFYRQLLLVLALFCVSANASELLLQWPENWEYQMVDRSENHMRLVAVHTLPNGVVDQSIEVHVVNLIPVDREDGKKPEAVTDKDVLALVESLKQAAQNSSSESDMQILPLTKQNGYYFSFSSTSRSKKSLGRQQLESVFLIENYLVNFASKADERALDHESQMLDMIESAIIKK